MKTRKVLAVVLALALLMGLSVVAYADNNTITSMPGSETIGVNGSYSGDGAIDVYSVKIEWGNMTFTYKTSGVKTWDPVTHTYSVADGDGWVFDEGENVVKVTNHSNVPVNVAFSFQEVEGLGTYTGTMSNLGRELAAGVENKPDEADFVTSALTLNGKLNLAVGSTATKLGEITVILSAVTVEP